MVRRSFTRTSGAAARSRAAGRRTSTERGADAIYRLNNGQMTFQSYYKMSAPQTSFENCVAHNGSLVPIPGRDITVQALVSGRHSASNSRIRPTLGRSPSSTAARWMRRSSWMEATG